MHLAGYVLDITLDKRADVFIYLKNVMSVCYECTRKSTQHTLYPYMFSIWTAISFPLNNTRNNKFHRINIAKITNWTANNSNKPASQPASKRTSIEKEQSQYSTFQLLDTCDKYNMNERIDFVT